MPRGHCWSPEEVRLLLAEIRGSGGVRLLMASTSRPNEALWRDICGELAARGYPRNVAQCRAKWKKMKQAFYSERAARRQGRPQGLCSPRHYALLRRLWKQAGRPVFGERRLPDAKNRDARLGRQEDDLHLRYHLSSPEEEYEKSTWPESEQAGLEENPSSANEEVQIKEENEEESDHSVAGVTPAWEMTSAGKQEMSDLSYPDLSPAQRINDPFSRRRSPSEAEAIVSHKSADVFTLPPHHQMKFEPQSSLITSCGQLLSIKRETTEREAEEVRIKREKIKVKKEEEEEDSDISLSSTTPAWDITSVGDQELSNLSYPEFTIGRETDIYPLPVRCHLKSEPQNQYLIGQETAGISPLPMGHRVKTEPLPYSSPCFPTLPIIASVTSFVPSLSIKQETREKEADSPPEHGASPAAGAGTMLGDQASAADMQGGSVVSLLQSMQQILAQLLHTSQQQQTLLESLANDTVSHLSLISDNLVQVGETLQEMLLRTHHRDQME
uniref:Uncharacterized protein LOC117356527 isoform X2 n=1 Tax=Geotrypetes seraphini TaxID=260995 RepID=A0A6P8Q881_GEOSA|nr:uncharacterized protein LOC117356527 isoform X2 [Geotrypetes seraphini]